jgi:hypothetical protein
MMSAIPSDSSSTAAGSLTVPTHVPVVFMLQFLIQRLEKRREEKKGAENKRG